MRPWTRTVLFASALFAAGCGSSPSTDMAGDLPTSDLARPGGDLATGGGDLATGGADMAMGPADLVMAQADLAAAPDLAMGANVATVNVGMGGATFSPKSVTIKVGESVRWVWIGGNHNVVSGNGAPDNKFCNPNNMSGANAPVVGAGTTYEFKFTQAGSFPYYCVPHFGAGMTGTVTVQ